MALTGCGDNSRECGLGTELVNGVCQGAQCGAGTVADAQGVCRPDGSIVCTDGTVFDEGACRPDITSCGAGLVLYEGACIDPAMVDPDYAAEGPIELADVGGQVTVHGCIDPAGGIPDTNTYGFTAAGPTLLDVTVDGYNGMSGAFVMDTAVSALVANEWIRFGLDLTNDMAKRQVFLPAAGDYLITVMDSRTLLSDLPAGDGNTCYLTTIATLEIPTPTPIAGLHEGSLNGEAMFYEYIAVEADIVFSQADSMNDTVLVDAVLMRNSQYFDSASGDFTVRPLGSGASSQMSNLAQDDQVVVVIDPVIDYGLDDADFALLVNTARPQPLPTDETISVEDNGFDTRFLFFDVVAGDVVHLRFASDAPGGLNASITDLDLNMIAGGCEPCSAYDRFVYFTDSGRYYLMMEDLSNPQPPSFQLTVNRVDHTPRAISGVGTALTGESLDVDGSTFYTVDWNAIEWVVYSGGAEADFFGDLELQFFERGRAGTLGIDVAEYHSFALDGDGGDRGHIYGAGDQLLIRARDNGFAVGTPGTFGFNISSRMYTHLGMVDGITPIEQIEVPLAAEETQLFLVEAPFFTEVSFRVGTDDGDWQGFDAVVDVFDKVENINEQDSGIGGEYEDFTVTSTQFVAFGVREFNEAPGDYDIRIGSTLPPVQVTQNQVTFASVCPADGGMGEEVSAFIGDNDDGLNATPFLLQFPFELLGSPVTQFNTWTNGFITFDNPPTLNVFYINEDIPSAAPPNGMIAPMWDDLQFVRLCYYDGPTEFVMQWEGVQWGDSVVARMQAIMNDDNSISFVYDSGHQMDSSSATVGLESVTGDNAFKMGFNDASNNLTRPGSSWTMTPF